MASKSGKQESMTAEYATASSQGGIMDIANAKEAAQKALEYTRDLVPGAKYAALEGIDFDDHDNTWNVIVGYLLEDDIPFSALAAATVPLMEKRTYKKLIIDSSTLEFKGMRPYDVARATRS